MDLYGGFPNVAPELVTLEAELLRAADLVVFSAAALQDRLRVGNRSAVVRNGCDYSRFATAPPVRTSDRITIGYVGAIDRWFDAALVNRCVETCPEWDFVLAGSTRVCLRWPFARGPTSSFSARSTMTTYRGSWPGGTCASFRSLTRSSRGASTR
jgi:hypothetical protein